MQIRNTSPNVELIYHYMKSKGYQPNYRQSSEGLQKRYVVFTTTLHNPDVPDAPSLKGLVVIHKIQIDMICGAVQKHWLENRDLGINSWQYVRKIEELYEKANNSFKDIKRWIKRGWIDQVLAKS